VKKNKIQWFNGDEKPVRSGVYQRKYQDGAILYCFFNAKTKMFGCSSPSASIAVEYNWRYAPSLNQNLPWAGIIK